ncbi:hypothetical protein HPT29_004745 [Microvirga terrae]|uniref:Thiamine pyrophosphate enzyme TPP-binding domain-containing protein n=1 Tax=Microvirga terrae TaxID=2740529 RepID=A0ABY5RT82_9HYPH|nr:hypothetical protein [Microvirga terrae]UVF20456.1 hypothetical protein HPT29_004745 [Microvirga terrae]
MSPMHVESAIELACRVALSHRGVAHVAIPVDVQEEPEAETKPSNRNLPHHASFAQTQSIGIPNPDAIGRAPERGVKGCEPGGTRRLSRALAERGSAPVEAVVDLTDLLLPPKRMEQYAKNLDKALQNGTPGRDEIKRALEEEPARTMLQE